MDLRAIEDPSHRRRELCSCKVDARCDGNNQMMRWFGCSIQTENVLKSAFRGIVEFLSETRDGAIARGYVLLNTSSGEVVRCFLASSNVECYKGRHRSVAQTNDIARQLRRAGCTVVVRFVHLY